MELGESESAHSKADEKKHNSRASASPLALVITTVTVLALGTGLGFALQAVFGEPRLGVAVQSCGLELEEFLYLDDDGQGLYLDGEGAGSSGLEVEDVVCVVSALDAPDSVVSRMANTTALMGQQTAKWDGVTALWSYHPNRGLDINFETE
jgi:hypothetical protein